MRSDRKRAQVSLVFSEEVLCRDLYSFDAASTHTGLSGNWSIQNTASVKQDHLLRKVVSFQLLQGKARVPYPLSYSRRDSRGPQIRMCMQILQTASHSGTLPAPGTNFCLYLRLAFF